MSLGWHSSGISQVRWVYRPVKPDYGIDGCVEVFDNNGQRTGRQFNVQLRATDEPNIKKALAVRLKIDACQYYKALDLPVLIARFRARTGKLYVKWFHEFDPYYARRGNKSTTFRMRESDEWTHKTAGILFGDVQKIKAIWSGTLPIPVTLQLQFLDGDIYGISPPQLSLNLRKALRALPGALEFKADSTASYGTVSLSNDKVTVSLAGLKTCTLHLGTSHDGNSARVGLHYDILVACAITLSSAGYCDLAARLFREFAAASSLVTNRDIGVVMAQCMIKAQRIREALNLAEVLLVKSECRYAAQGLFIAMLRNTDAMSEGERLILQTFLERCTRIEEGTKDPLSAATPTITSGTTCVRQNRIGRAFDATGRRPSSIRNT